MYIVIYRSSGISGDTVFKECESEDEAVGFAIRRKGYVIEARDPIKEIKEEK